MSETERITKEVCDRHGLPPSLAAHTDHNALYAPDGREELRAAMRGKPYLDVDGNWHTGRDYRDQSDVSEPEQVSEAFFVGVRNGFIISASMLGITWLFFNEAWPRIWAWIARIF